MAYSNLYAVEKRETGKRLGPGKFLTAQAG